MPPSDSCGDAGGFQVAGVALVSGVIAWESPQSDEVAATRSIASRKQGPHVLAQEIADDLRSTLKRIEEVLEDLTRHEPGGKALTGRRHGFSWSIAFWAAWRATGPG